MFSRASAILSTVGCVSQHALGRGVCLPRGDVCPRGGVHPSPQDQRQTPPSRTRGRHPPDQRQTRPLQRTVRILLECILVQIIFALTFQPTEIAKWLFFLSGISNKLFVSASFYDTEVFSNFSCWSHVWFKDNLYFRIEIQIPLLDMSPALWQWFLGPLTHLHM